MVTSYQRSPNDIFGWPILGFIFKNRRFIWLVRALTLGLFAYAMIYGFLYPTKEENLFTTALFWSLFWPFFMVITLPTFGAIFCGICPHGTLGRWIQRFGLNRPMPSWLATPAWGLGLILVSYWLILYIFPGLYKTPWIAALFFLAWTLVAIVMFWLFGKMSYCKSLCPLGAITSSFSKVGFTWLSTYSDACAQCKSFDCAKACPYGLSPFNFDKNNSMENCKLCMECAHACEAVRFEVKKPSASLFKAIPRPRAWQVWTFILIAGAATITMQLHHGLGRTGLMNSLPWVLQANLLYDMAIFPETMDVTGLLAFGYGLAIALIFGVGGLWLAAKILGGDIKAQFLKLGYGLAPLMIIGGLSHVLSFFFLHYYSDLVNGFSQAFALGLPHQKPLASFKEPWMKVFDLFNYLAVIWSLVLIWTRLKLTEAPLQKRLLAFIPATALVWAYLFLVIFRTWALIVYGVCKAHGAH